MFRLDRQRRQAPSLLARYSETFGELTLRRQTELAMVAAKAESDLANRAKTAFLGTISHELRTPLNAIIGFSDLIRDQKPTETSLAASADYASHIGEAGRHLLEVVSDILDYSKIEGRAFALDSEPCSVAKIIEESLPMTAGQIEAKHQRLEVRIERRIPQLNVDARRIRQIVVNLLANAARHTPERGRILVAARANRGGGATIAVVDSGPGMSADEIALALTPFGQVQPHLSRVQEGVGLGLPIARGLARQHGGDLYLESEPGAGTTAVLTLPGPDAGAGGRPSSAAAGGGERLSPRRAAHSAREP